MIPEPFLSTAYHVVDRLAGIVSVASLFTAVGVFGSWQIQQPTIQAVNVGSRVEVKSGFTTYLPTPAMLDRHVGTSVYQAWVLDAENNVVYRFPDIVFNNQAAYISSLEFPKTLPPGRYYIKGTITYDLNPIKRADLPVNFGIVEVR
ncbi:hypothetical protein [Achromobacter phage Motura]|uniref:Uncharacterized protein n=1 Tax=Achromobacter phage Motura TaxID=2591403 RepID=A0A514CTA1_9CAUD|nr:hypothetical protein H1O15_gp117 [Achromobacter phage Motura]QDH83711.1 hypothetical protein [Achromobacter phage Motura]